MRTKSLLLAGLLGLTGGLADPYIKLPSTKGGNTPSRSKNRAFTKGKRARSLRIRSNRRK